MTILNRLQTLATCAALMLSGCGAVFGPAESSPADTGKVDARSNDEMAERKLVFGQVDAAITANDFTALDKLEQQLLSSRARTPSGVWKLGVYHAELQFRLAKGMDRANGCSQPGAAFAARWLQHSPAGPAAIITAADLALSKAWCFRGDGYAASVPAKFWPAFHAGVADAYNRLTKSRKAASTDPEYYSVMTKVYRAKGASQAETMTLVREASDREPYYGRTYFAAALNFLPQWGGSMEEVDQLARFAAAKTRTSDKLGYYVRAYWTLEECGCADMATDPDWSTLKQSMNDLVERYPAPFNAKYFMDLTCKRGDADDAMPFIRMLTPTALSDADRIIWVDGCKQMGQTQT